MRVRENEQLQKTSGRVGKNSEKPYGLVATPPPHLHVRGLRCGGGEKTEVGADY